jgi:hypothetical protein
VTDSVELWRKNYYHTSLIRLTLGSVSGLLMLILISVHRYNTDDLCELTNLYESYQFDIDSLTKMNILSLWTLYLLWTVMSLHFMLMARQYVRDPICEREGHRTQLL